MSRELKTYLSGGTTNTDPDASLGGAQSTTETGIQTPSWDSTSMTGVTLVASGGNKPDLAGTITFDFAALTMTYDPPGYTSGTQNTVDVSANGTYVLYGEDSTDTEAVGAVEVTIVSASLPGSNDTQDIVNADTANNLFDDISKADSTAGSIEYRCIYVDNVDAITHTLNIWIDRQPSPDSVQIGFDPTGAGGTAAVIADEDTAPASVSFTTPSEASPLAVSLTTGQAIAVWIKRTISASNQVSNLNDAFLLGVKVA